GPLSPRQRRRHYRRGRRPLRTAGAPLNTSCASERLAPSDGLRLPITESSATTQPVSHLAHVSPRAAEFMLRPQQRHSTSKRGQRGKQKMQKIGRCSPTSLSRFLHPRSAEISVFAGNWANGTTFCTLAGR